MIIIPAIDLLDGKIVRLKQGRYNQKIVYNNDPVDQALKFVEQGAKCLHIVDLDGARGCQMQNLDVILQIRKKVKIFLQVGGGIRHLKQIDELLTAGINRVVLSTRAIKELTFLEKALGQFGIERVAVSLDVKNDDVMIKGWGSKGHQEIDRLLQGFKLSGLKYLIYTDIKKDGMMSSPNFDNIKKIQKYCFDLIIAGGISTVKDIKKLKEIGIYGCIIGRAVYEDMEFLRTAFALLNVPSYKL